VLAILLTPHGASGGFADVANLLVIYGVRCYNIEQTE